MVKSSLWGISLKSDRSEPSASQSGIFSICLRDWELYKVRLQVPRLAGQAAAATQMPQAAEWDLLLGFIDPGSKDRLDLCGRDSPGFKTLCVLRIRKSRRALTELLPNTVMLAFLCLTEMKQRWSI